MESNTTSDLRERLSMALLGHPWTPSAAPETHLIDFLCEYEEQWEHGSYSYPELKAVFTKYVGEVFDLDQWLQQWTDAGEFIDPFNEHFSD